MSAAAAVATPSGAPAADSTSMVHHEVVRTGLRGAAAELESAGVAVPPLAGKLLRPLVAYALVPPHRRADLDEQFWMGAWAVQMVHEASLLHDDILDDAVERRGAETLVARGGVGPALVLGDQYLTGSYRAAARVGSPAFLDAFIVAVERTVAGEVAQHRSAGRRLDPAEYEDAVVGKSGELFGAAACLGGAFLGSSLADRVALGRALGSLYQRVDDLLDYCSAADTGKPPLQDYRQGKWTWVLDRAGIASFDATEENVLAALFDGRDDGPSAARRALDDLRRRRDALVDRAAALVPGDRILAGVVDSWLQAAARGVSLQEAQRAGHRPPASGRGRPSPEAEVAELARAVGGPEAWPAYFGRHARTFRFAARLFPAPDAARVAGLYAWCRFSDDLVDEPHDDADPERVAARLEAWRGLARAAYDGDATEVPLVDVVLRQAREARVDWRYPSAVLDGVAMDLSVRRYGTWHDLEVYTFGVAGAVGGWMTQLFGLHDPDLLHRAHALGHGMQLTNILRDVGEDWRMGRLYLPATLMEANGLRDTDLDDMVRGCRPVGEAWRAAMAELVGRADGYYDLAWPGIRALPPGFRRPVAVAAAAYHGIHREVERSGFDNLTRRAHTSRTRKLVLGARGLWRARRGP